MICLSDSRWTGVSHCRGRQHAAREGPRIKPWRGQAQPQLLLKFLFLQPLSFTRQPQTPLSSLLPSKSHLYVAGVSSFLAYFRLQTVIIASSSSSNSVKNDPLEYRDHRAVRVNQHFLLRLCSLPPLPSHRLLKRHSACRSPQLQLQLQARYRQRQLSRPCPPRWTYNRSHRQV